MDGTRAKKAAFRYPAHSLQKQVLLSTTTPMESIYSEGVPFGMSTHHISRTPNKETADP